MTARRSRSARRTLAVALVGLASACAAPQARHPLEREPASADFVGRLRFHAARKNDTLVDLAVRYGVGYVELLAANPGVDPWVPPEHGRLVIPDVHLIPSGPREGIVINLGEMRLYYFEPGARPRSYPIGIAREGFATPKGSTQVTAKREKPTWIPGPSARRDGYPAVVPPGPDNPMGDYALNLGWPSYRIHGTNEPPGVGRHTSRGCIRLYPDDIEELFGRVEVGTPVRVIDEAVKLAWLDGELWLEVHPSPAQAQQLDEQSRFDPSPPRGLRELVLRAAGGESARVEWDRVELAGRERTGVPRAVIHKPRPQIAPR